MADAVFEGAVSEARRLEKKLVEYAPYQEEVHIGRTLDLEPREYMDLSYNDMVNLYERNQKIISTAGMGILAAKAEEAVPTTAKTGEVESKLREMTTETLQKAEEVGHEPIVLEREAVLEKEETQKPVQHIEFEERAATEVAEKEEEPELEKEEPQMRAPELEEEKEAAAEHEEKQAETEKPTLTEAKAPERPLPKTLTRGEGPEVEVPERKVLVAAVPPALMENPDQAGARRYAQMKEQITAAVGENADEATIKKKMLELTKQLFKEKMTSKREEIKLQITALKNMLSAAPAGGRTAVSKKKETGTNARIFQSMADAQQTELAHTKDSIIDSYNKQVAEIRRRFYDNIATTEDPVARKKIFESFMFSVTSLVEQLPDVLAKYKEFTSKKHAAEMEKLAGSLEEDEKDIRKAVEGRLAIIRKGYESDFTSVKDMIARDIENLIEKTGTDVLKAEGEKPAASEAKAQEIVAGINETDEGTLLYYLHSKDAEYYKRYERKQLAKAEALLRAKQLMAKEKGLSDSMAKKFFGKMEG